MQCYIAIQCASEQFRAVLRLPYWQPIRQYLICDDQWVEKRWLWSSKARMASVELNGFTPLTLLLDWLDWTGDLFFTPREDIHRREQSFVSETKFDKQLIKIGFSRVLYKNIAITESIVVNGMAMEWHSYGYSRDIGFCFTTSLHRCQC